ncbi:helix-turn-helix transcriptional regulator [Listeria innocua]|uniref:Helix-turn-helix transcriptional regulator n=1 Tax=Listeria innocua TaxID=1642 RepID=A0AB73H588_LISIO|nr:helix-turn-helix transcriptional regulator [Listeria innocua]EDO1162090.1 helix-turn-helix domain-containing protein [Listeria innocua]EJQ0569385.1 helix-turn-helix transcriptional regulator [Listeria innocua]EKF1877053.1 helix-turn-helix transcriptional regulator [Listeria innocua]EKK3338731.1 helix-turn-helix transcriptional regulator [Listeria innocua]EKY3961807.1 helix-turn-helix transcriptional regulator [Listeria innocua]
MYYRIEDADLSQEQLAKLLNISQTTYSRYETGNIDIPSQSLVNLAQYYSTSIDYLVGVANQKTLILENKFYSYICFMRLTHKNQYAKNA